MRGEQGKAEAEVWRREDCESLDQDVRDSLFSGEVWIELIPSSQKFSNFSGA